MNVGPCIWIASAEVYLSEAEARAAIVADLNPPVLGAYCGLWSVPTPERTIVHLFTDCDPAELTAQRWTLMHSRPPGPDTVAWQPAEIADLQTRALTMSNAQ
jgi:hypothetical protein